MYANYRIVMGQINHWPGPFEQLTWLNHYCKKVSGQLQTNANRYRDIQRAKKEYYNACRWHKFSETMAFLRKTDQIPANTSKLCRTRKNIVYLYATKNVLQGGKRDRSKVEYLMYTIDIRRSFFGIRHKTNVRRNSACQHNDEMKFCIYR